MQAPEWTNEVGYVAADVTPQQKEELTKIMKKYETESNKVCKIIRLE